MPDADTPSTSNVTTTEREARVGIANLLKGAEIHNKTGEEILAESENNSRDADNEDVRNLLIAGEIDDEGRKPQVREEGALTDADIEVLNAEMFSEDSEIVDKKSQSKNRQDLTTPPAEAEVTSSSSKGVTKLRNITDNLTMLSKTFNGQRSHKGVITDLANAIGATRTGEGVSRYAKFELPNGNVAEVRISNHNANAETFAEHGHTEDNVSIVIKSRRSRNTFRPHPDVELVEYVYPTELIATDGEVLSGIAESLRGMIETGEYVDLTGKAMVNKSPEGDAEPGRQYSMGTTADLEGDRDYTEAEVNSLFDEQLKQQSELGFVEGDIYRFGYPSEKLAAVGFPIDQEIQMSAAHLDLKSKDKYHPFDIKSLNGLVQALRNPLAVFPYGKATNALNAIVEIRYGDDNFLIGVHFNQRKGDRALASIRSIFPKYNTEWLTWIEKGQAIGLDKARVMPIVEEMRDILSDKEKTEKYMSTRLTRGDHTDINLDLVAKIVKEFGAHKGEVVFDEIENSDIIRFDRRYSIDSEAAGRMLDAMYAEAVGRGDIETAMSLLRRAAEEKGYNEDESEGRMSHKAPNSHGDNARIYGL